MLDHHNIGTIKSHLPVVLAPDTCPIYCVLSLAVVKRASHLSFPDLFDSLERLTDTITMYVVVTSRMNVGLLFLQQTISGKKEHMGNRPFFAH